MADQIDEHPVGVGGAGGMMPVNQVFNAVLGKQVDGVVAEACVERGQVALGGVVGSQLKHTPSLVFYRQSRREVGWC